MYSLVIVDDETAILEQLKSVFNWEEMGFSVAGCFTDANDALEYLRKNGADILLTDINLGSKTGLELAADARNLLPDITLVILSAYSDFEYARTALRYRMFDYLLKPVTYADITNCFSAVKAKLDASAGVKKTDPSGKPDNEGADKDYRITIVKQYIEKNIGGDITLENMASLVSMNPAYFSRFFKRSTNVYYADYVTRRKMEKAIELLRNPGNRIFEICTMVGYFSKQNFYKRFHQYTGRTPVEYRNKVLRIEDYDEE